MDLTPAETPLPKSGLTLQIFSPEGSERLLREEPRIPADVVLAERYREFGEKQPR